MPLNEQASGDHLESESYLNSSKHAGYRVGSAKFRYCKSSSWMRASAAELSTASTPSEIPRTASRSKSLIFCAPGAISGASISRRSAAARYTLPHANMMPIDVLVHRDSALLLRAWFEHEADAFHPKMAAAARRQVEEVRKVRKDGKRGSSSRSGQWLHGSQANADPIWVAKKIKIFVLSREKTAKFSSRGSAPHPARAPALDPLFTHQAVFGALFGSGTVLGS